MQSEQQIKDGLAECKAEIKKAAKELYEASLSDNYEKMADCMGFLTVGISATIAINEILKDE